MQQQTRTHELFVTFVQIRHVRKCAGVDTTIMSWAINDCVRVFHKTILVRVRTRPNTVKTTTVHYVPATVATHNRCETGVMRLAIRTRFDTRETFFYRKTTLILIDGNFPKVLPRMNERAFPKRHVFITSVTTADAVRLKRNDTCVHAKIPCLGGKAIELRRIQTVNVRLS